MCVVLSCISYYQYWYMMWCFIFSVHIYLLIFLSPFTLLDSFSFLKCNVAVGRYDPFVRFEVLMALFMNIYIWDVALIRQVEIFGRFRKTYSFHF